MRHAAALSTGGWRLSLWSMAAWSALCAVSIRLGDFLILPTLFGVNFVLLLATRGAVARNMAIGFFCGAAAALVFASMGVVAPESPDTGSALSDVAVAVLYIGLAGAAFVGNITAMGQGHRALGRSILIILLFGPCALIVAVFMVLLFLVHALSDRF